MENVPNGESRAFLILQNIEDKNGIQLKYDSA